MSRITRHRHHGERVACLACGHTGRIVGEGDQGWVLWDAPAPLPVYSPQGSAECCTVCPALASNSPGVYACPRTHLLVQIAEPIAL